MYQIPVYRAELADGLGPALAGRPSVLLASAVAAWADAPLEELGRAATGRPEGRAEASLGDFDLHPFTSILVSTGWNKNDDVFDPLEVWAARHTPAHKAVNYEHDCAQIMGHIVATWGLAGGAAIPEDSAADGLPADFDLACGAVLYKYWARPELQQKADLALAEMAAGTLFVSMEVLFRGLDYALKGADGATRVVARDARTAHMSRHLRAYGGTGEYGGERVGRLLRNPVFSGKGLVRKPANPASVILSSGAGGPTPDDSGPVSSTRVYTEANENKAGAKTMPDTDNAQAFEQLRAENERLKASLLEGDVAKMRDRAEAAERLLKEADAALTKAASEAAAAVAERDQLKTKLSEAEASLASTREELGSMHAAARLRAREGAVAEKLQMDAAEAAEFVKASEQLDDAAFGRQVELLAARAAKQTPAPLPAKETPAPLPPKQTPAPIPGVASDKAGEQAAAAADLDGAVPDAAPTLTVPPGDGVRDVQKAIAEFIKPKK